MTLALRQNVVFSRAVNSTQLNTSLLLKRTLVQPLIQSKAEQTLQARNVPWWYEFQGFGLVLVVALRPQTLKHIRAG
jgi:hypothetical protein